MGSFANSLHVRGADTEAVSSAIRRIMQNNGFVTTDEAPSEEAIWGMSSSPRAMHVSEASDGWVTVLDSDLMNMSDLGLELSRLLETYVILFLVNDSDSWHYQLFYAGGDIDSFDSSGEYVDEGDDEFDDESLAHGGLRLFPNEEAASDDEDAEDEATDDIEALKLDGPFNPFLDSEDAEADDIDPAMAARLASMPPEFREHIDQLFAAVQQDMPDDMRAIQLKIDANTATAEDQAKFQNWLMQQMPMFVQELSEAFASELELGGETNPPSEEDLLEHLAFLRPLLKPGVSLDEAVEVMGELSVFAEMALAKFLPLVGINPLHAYLSYAYRQDHTTEVLDQAGIRFRDHLKFKTAT
ncbi:MAG: hypothetical protein KDA62_19090 [Planctomycetales bacterium]|nr:hypothetical protein [Planctomycetales bacterium]